MVSEHSRAPSGSFREPVKWEMSLFHCTHKTLNVRFLRASDKKQSRKEGQRIRIEMRSMDVDRRMLAKGRTLKAARSEC